MHNKHREATVKLNISILVHLRDVRHGLIHEIKRGKLLTLRGDIIFTGENCSCPRGSGARVARTTRRFHPRGTDFNFRSRSQLDGESPTCFQTRAATLLTPLTIESRARTQSRARPLVLSLGKRYAIRGTHLLFPRIRGS